MLAVDDARATSRAAAPRARPRQDCKLRGLMRRTFSATRSTALRARGLRAISASLAMHGAPTRRSRGRACGGIVRQPGIDRVALRFALHEALDEPVLERMEADHARAGRRRRAARRPAASARSSASSSPFTRMRIAWNVRVAGCLPGSRVGTARRDELRELRRARDRRERGARDDRARRCAARSVPRRARTACPRSRARSRARATRPRSGPTRCPCACRAVRPA